MTEGRERGWQWVRLQLSEGRRGGVGRGGARKGGATKVGGALSHHKPLPISKK